MNEVLSTRSSDLELPVCRFNTAFGRSRVGLVSQTVDRLDTDSNRAFAKDLSRGSYYGPSSLSRPVDHGPGRGHRGRGYGFTWVGA